MATALKGKQIKPYVCLKCSSYISYYERIFLCSRNAGKLDGQQQTGSSIADANNVMGSESVSEEDESDSVASSDWNAVGSERWCRKHSPWFF